MGKAKPKTYRKECNHSNVSKRLKMISETTKLIKKLKEDK